MHFQRLLPLVLACGVASATGCQLIVSPFLAANKKSQSNPSAASKPKPRPKALASGDSEAYQQTVWERFVKDDFSWIDSEARKLRKNKERLAGGYFKLRLLYRTLETPPNPDEASNGDWEDHIARLERWVKEEPSSLTARIGLAEAMKAYAWKARGEGYANTVTKAGMKAFDERLATAAKVLQDASSLEERCPEWYFVALWVGIGQGWERAALDRIFQAAVELEPTYYYFYQAKATYLLPRWYGEEGESEKFAEESTLKVGGHQGDIIFFTIYSALSSMHDVTFMNTHQQARPRILDGFRSIDKLYGATPHQVNEACFFAFGSNDHQMIAELFNRIGEDYDPQVWGSKETFEVFRKGALRVAQAEKNKQSPAQSSPK